MSLSEPSSLFVGKMTIDQKPHISITDMLGIMAAVNNEVIIPQDEQSPILALTKGIM